jgi:hypothetical protein
VVTRQNASPREVGIDVLGKDICVKLEVVWSHCIMSDLHRQLYAHQDLQRGVFCSYMLFQVGRVDCWYGPDLSTAIFDRVLCLLFLLLLDLFNLFQNP